MIVSKNFQPGGVFRENARRIADLHARIHETLKRRDTSAEARAEWAGACEEFHRLYDSLAFPGGYESGMERIRAGDQGAIEDALAFVEIRPYFFRSQFMCKKLTRLLKHASLAPAQEERFQKVLDADRARKALRSVG
jgi:hypothetical protein